MADVLFTYPRHSESPTLAIDTGANRIAWSYNLNTQAFPTYGGEVVQVLSTNIDVLTIQGDVRSYAEMERIYKWFLFYVQDATQGYAGNPTYSETPVMMQYPERGWTLAIQPISLPGLKYGRDVVVPQWQMQAHVIDPDPEMAELTISESLEAKETFRNLTADIGFRVGNPFSDPIATYTDEEKKLYPKGIVNTEDQLRGIGKRLNDMTNSFVNGELGDITKQFEVSGPASAPKQGDTPDQEKPGKPKNTPANNSSSTPTDKPTNTSAKPEEVRKNGKFYKGTDDRIYYQDPGERLFLATEEGMVTKFDDSHILDKNKIIGKLNTEGTPLGVGHGSAPTWINYKKVN